MLWHMITRIWRKKLHKLEKNGKPDLRNRKIVSTSKELALRSSLGEASITQSSINESLLTAELVSTFATPSKRQTYLTLSWRRPLSYRNQPIDLLQKSVDWFLHDNGLRDERVKKDNRKKNLEYSYVNYAAKPQTYRGLAVITKIGMAWSAVTGSMQCAWVFLMLKTRLSRALHFDVPRITGKIKQL